MKKKKPVIVTSDKNISKEEVDKLSSRGFIRIESTDQFMELAKAANETYNKYGESIKKIMTPKRAALVRNLRIHKGYSWRMVAQECFDAFGDATWNPPSNQLAGMQLCRIAGEVLNEPFDENA